MKDPGTHAADARVRLSEFRAASFGQLIDIVPFELSGGAALPIDASLLPVPVDPANPPALTLAISKNPANSIPCWG